MASLWDSLISQTVELKTVYTDEYDGNLKFLGREGDFFFFDSDGDLICLNEEAVVSITLPVDKNVVGLKKLLDGIEAAKKSEFNGLLSSAKPEFGGGDLFK